MAERLGEEVRAQLPRAKPVVLREDRLGQLWIYYGRTGLWRIDRDGRLDSWLPGDGADAAPDAGFDLMAEDTRGRLWLSVPGEGLEARDIVTGKKKFAMDLDIPGALPTMVCRAPDLNGTPKRIRNRARIRAMPGVTHVAADLTDLARDGWRIVVTTDDVKATRARGLPRGVVEGVERVAHRPARQLLTGLHGPVPPGSAVPPAGQEVLAGEPDEHGHHRRVRQLLVRQPLEDLADGEPAGPAVVPHDVHDGALERTERSHRHDGHGSFGGLSTTDRSKPSVPTS